MIVGLTGGIGSGKSTVAQIFKNLGVPVYDSDKEAKLLMNTSSSIKKAIVNLLGSGAYQNNILNRNYISSKVFNDKKLLSKLNKIVHPEVKKHFEEWSVRQESKYVIQETALIFENESQENYDKIILVVAPLEERIKRVMARDSTGKEAVLDRVENQLSDIEKISLADYIIENIDLEKTAKRIDQIHYQLLSEPK